MQSKANDPINFKHSLINFLLQQLMIAFIANMNISILLFSKFKSTDGCMKLLP